MVSWKNGSEGLLEEKETTMSFTLNDHARFRINDKGEIQQVQGYDLEIGKNYHIAYAPYKNNPEVEIITMLEWRVAGTSDLEVDGIWYFMP